MITTIIVADLIIVTVAVMLSLMTTGKPSRYFGEGRFTTVISCVQLLAVAFFSSRIFVARQSHALQVGSLSGAWVWRFIAIGFVFLAADDAFQIHEWLDHIVHRMLDLQETAWTDRLDDAIIALYGLIGLALLWLFRREICCFTGIWKSLSAGFLCLFISIVCDTLSNDEQLLFWLFTNVRTGQSVKGWISVGDGAFTLLAEGVFLGGFYLANQEAIRSCDRGMPAFQSPAGASSQ